MSAVFAQEWKACVSIASQAVFQRATLGNNWLSWVLLAMAALIAAGVFAAGAGWRVAIGFGFGLPLSLLAWLWWFYIVDAVRKQNHPAAFRLVPRMAARSRWVLFAVWAGLTLAIGLIMSLPVGNAALCCFGVGLFFAVTAAMLQWQVSAGVAVLMFAPYAADKLGLPLESWATFGMHGFGPLVIGCVLLLASAWGIGRQLGRGPAQPRPNLSQGPAPVPLYAASLRAASESGDRTRLLMHVLGPAADNRTQALLLALLLGGAVIAAALSGIPAAVQKVFLVSVALAVQFGVADRLSAQIYARHREQALLRLAVHAPAALAVNAVLSRALMRRFLGWWMTTTAAALALALLSGDGDSRVLPLLAVFCMPLMAAGALLHSYAPRPHVGMRSRTAMVAWFLLTYAMFFISMLDVFGNVTWAAIALAAASMAYFFVSSRARSMGRAACSFPAGRGV